MAEDLGVAKLELQVDLDLFRKGLREARELISDLNGEVQLNPGAKRRQRKEQTPPPITQVVDIDVNRNSIKGLQEALSRLEQRRIRLNVNSDEFKSATQLAERLKGRITELQTPTQFGRRRSGGASESIFALERAQNRRFALARRIDDLESKGGNVSKLRTQLGRVTEAQSAREFEAARRLSNELARQIVLAERRTKANREAAASVTRLAERGARQGGPRENLDARFQAQKRRYSLDQQIRSLEAAGVKSDRLRASLGGVSEAQAKSQFGSAKRLSDQLSFQLQKERDKLRVQRDQQATFERAARQGGARSPVGGSLNIPGSPAYIQAQIRAQERLKKVEESAFTRLAKLGGASSPVRGRIDIEGSPAAIEAENKAIARQIELDRRLAEQREQNRRKEVARNARQGGASSPVSGRLRDGSVIEGSPAFKRLQEKTLAGFDANLLKFQQQDNKRLNQQVESVRKQQLAAENEKLIALRADAAAAKRAADKRGKKAKDAIGSAIIGGAFPALFGQGIGASVGGGLGGLAGGAIGGQFGFGLSLVGTALGAQVDAAVAKLGVLGSALKDPVANFQELAQAGLISSAALERNIAALIANGKEAEAAALIQLDAARQFGDTSDIEALSSANAELSRSFSQLSVQLVKVAAGPLSNFISTLAASFKVFSEKGLVEERFKQAGINDNERKTILAQARNNTAADREDLSQGQGFLITLTEINRLLDERIGKTKEVAQAESASAKAIERSDKLRSNSFRAIDTQVFGNKALTLEIEKQNVELERQQQIAAKGKGIQPEERKAIDQKAALETYRINQDIAKLDRERYANNIVSANKLRDIQAEIAIQSAKPGLSSIGEGALQALRQLEQARRNVEEAQAKAAVTPGDQGLAAESIIASKQLELAGISVRNSLREAFQNGEQAVQDLSRALQDSQLRLSEQRGGTGGVNSFLSGQALLNRQTAEFQRLLPQFTAVREQLARQQSDPFVASGIRNTNFSGATADVNKSLIEFIRSAREEMRVVQDQKVIETQLRVAQSNQALIQSLTTSGEQTNTLTANVNLLREAVAALTGKDWAVSVNVNTDNGAATVQTIQGL